MLNQRLLELARWLAAQDWSIGLHESLYLYAWIESSHVLALMLFLGMLCVIDLRMLGVGFMDIPASRVAACLDKPMIVGFGIMIATGLLLFYAIPIRTTQSIWFRCKVVLLLVAGINAWLFRARMKASVDSWDTDRTPPVRIRVGAGLSLALWSGVVFCGRAIAYDWFDCSKEMPFFMYWIAGCVDEMAGLE